MADGKAIAEIPLREVKLGQLPKWLATCSFTPSGVKNAVVRNFWRYHTKYINVRKANIAPIGQFVALTIGLTYIWRFKKEKHHRIRKYH
ncbi:ATP synthase subunit f, mitochondrial-like isoform X2 [Antedon mediterranea]|uniref:ATP synthase subunit f, mitochondrial-like isoform X2 n=1 Tax=Antedon mediterranea TaxID=105859 RepID=UPI003AF4140C